MYNTVTFALVGMAAVAVAEAYNDAGNAMLRVAVAFQVLRNSDKDTGRQCHVKYSVRLFSARL